MVEGYEPCGEMDTFLKPIHCDRTAIDLPNVYKQTHQFALSVVFNDAKLHPKTSVSLRGATTPKRQIKTPSIMGVG